MKLRQTPWSLCPPSLCGPEVTLLLSLSSVSTKTLSVLSPATPSVLGVGKFDSLKGKKKKSPLYRLNGPSHLTYCLTIFFSLKMISCIFWTIPIKLDKSTAKAVFSTSNLAPTAFLVLLKGLI